MAGQTQNVVVSLCSCANGQPLSKEWLSNIQLPKKVYVNLNQFRINLTILIAGKKDVLVERIVESVSTIVNALNTYGCVNCDEKGVVGPSAVYQVGGDYMLLAQETAAGLYAAIQRDSNAQANTNENYVGGVVGALIGSLLGAAVILLIAMLGRIAAIGGIAMGAGGVFGYKKLGKKFSVFSVIICIAIAVLMTYLTCQMSAAIDIYKAWDGSESLGYCFSHAKEIYEWSGELGVYNRNFILMMIVGIAGAVVMAFVELSSEKQKYNMIKID